MNALSNHISMVAQATLLSAELERSRLTIVAAQEESWHCLGNDLHDGVEVQIAGMARQIEQGVQLLEHDPAVMRELLAEVAKQVNKIMAQVRNLAHQLHPPELEPR